MTFYDILILILTLFEIVITIIMLTVTFPGYVINYFRGYMKIFMYNNDDPSVELKTYTVENVKISYYFYKTTDSSGRCILDVPGGAFVYCCNNIDLYKKLFSVSKNTCNVFSVIYPTIVSDDNASRASNIGEMINYIQLFFKHVMDTYVYSDYVVFAQSAGTFLSLNALNLLETEYSEKVTSFVSVCGYFGSMYFNKDEYLLRFVWWYYSNHYAKTDYHINNIKKLLLITSDKDFLKNNNTNYYNNNMNASFYVNPNEGHTFLYYSDANSYVYKLINKFLNT